MNTSKTITNALILALVFSIVGTSTLLGNRIIQNGHTQWIMILKDGSLELWGVNNVLLSLKHMLVKQTSTPQ